MSTNKQKLVKGPVVLYEQMRIKILELIEERNLQPHDPIPSEGELAELFGVSKRTSKEALLALAKEGIVYRMPRRGTFLAAVPGEDQQVKDTCKGYLGMVVPEIDDYVGKVLSAVLRETLNMGWDLIVRVSGGDMKTEGALLRELANDPRIKGILLFPGDRKICGDEVLRLHLERYPIVILDRTFREINLPSVYHDHYQGAYELTEHFIQNGHRNIAFVSEELFGVMSREERYQGFIQAHLANKLTFNPDWVFTDLERQDPNNTEAEVKETSTERFVRFLSENREITAIFCSNDYVALKVLNMAQKLQRMVPEEISLGGFTDLPIASLMAVPLTTIRKPPETIGERAVHLLLGLMKQEEQEPQSCKLPTQLIIRDSVKFLHQESSEPEEAVR